MYRIVAFNTCNPNSVYYRNLFMPLKEKIFVECLSLINNRIDQLRNNLKELLEGAAAETKSSAGDKHETSRAMTQLEQEKLSYQLAETEKQLAVFEKINPQQQLQTITTGSLVVTNLNILFFASAIGKINVDGVDVMVLSIQSPLGIALKGKTKGDAIHFNGKEILIKNVE